MTNERINAFSDGVIAILITIMVLKLKVPHGTDLAALSSLLPVFLTYVLSFIVLGIYWSNHHHMFYLTDSARVRESVILRCDLRVRGLDVACAGPKNRAAVR